MKLGMMCGKEKIRFIHIVSHNDINEEYRVGCVCSEKMTNDYINPKSKEKELGNRANRRKTWGRKKWKTFENGIYLNYKNHRIVIFKDSLQQYKVKIDKTHGKKIFEDLKKTKFAAFDGIEYFKKKGEW